MEQKVLTKNYFDFFEIQPAFFPDLQGLRKQYYVNSRKYHPDHVNNSDEGAEEDVLLVAGLNNEAYRVLSDFDLRVEYIIKTFNGGRDINSIKLPDDFLMEMMDINEQIEAISQSKTLEGLDELRDTVIHLDDALYQDAEPIMKKFDEEGGKKKIDEKLIIYFLKKKYLLRIKESLSTFADHLM